MGLLIVSVLYSICWKVLDEIQIFSPLFWYGFYFKLLIFIFWQLHRVCNFFFFPIGLGGQISIINRLLLSWPMAKIVFKYWWHRAMIWASKGDPYTFRVPLNAYCTSEILCFVNFCAMLQNSKNKHDLLQLYGSIWVGLLLLHWSNPVKIVYRNTSIIKQSAWQLQCIKVYSFINSILLSMNS